MHDKFKYDYLLSISKNNFIVDSVPIICNKFNKKARRSDTFIKYYCEDCTIECEGKMLKCE